MRFYPTHLCYSEPVARARTWREYHIAVVALGPDHPATLAAWGRVQFHEGNQPEEHVNVAAVAWYRESGILGFRNRTERGQG